MIPATPHRRLAPAAAAATALAAALTLGACSVSYTHLTLPTILRV